MLIVVCMAATFSLFASEVSAKEILVPANGTDTDLAAAIESAETGDILIISGWLSFDAPVTIDKNITLKWDGEGNSGGFDGQFKTKLFELAPEAIVGEKLSFIGLGFVGGLNEDDGGVGRIVNGETEFLDCFFEDNETTGRGGAFFIANPEGGEVGATTARFISCDAANNTAGNRGGFAFIAGDAVTSYDFCRIKNNASIGDRGGAFFFEATGTHRFFYSVIDANTSGIEGGGGEIGGAAITTAGGMAITLESCAIVRNVCYGNHGAAFFTMGNPNITLINTLVAGNMTAEGAGGWFIPSDNIDITFVNTAWINNTGTNPGNGGGGLRVMNTGNRINLFNSIVARNTCQDGTAVDFRFDAKPDIASTLVFKNSIVGLLSGLPLENVPVALDNPAIENTSLINMYSLNGEDSQLDYAALDVSGVNWIDGMQVTDGFGMPFMTLENGDAYAAKLGDPALLADYDLTTDIFQKERTISGGAIYAFPVQSVTGLAENVDEPRRPTSIKALPALKKEFRVIGVVENGILGVDFGEIKGATRGELITLTGQVVQTIFDRNVVGKGYYNVNVPSGIYLLRLTNNGTAYTQKMIVK
jgi:hypothetical protein